MGQVGNVETTGYRFGERVIISQRDTYGSGGLGFVQGLCGRESQAILSLGIAFLAVLNSRLYGNSFTPAYIRTSSLDLGHHGRLGYASALLASFLSFFPLRPHIHRRDLTTSKTLDPAESNSAGPFQGENPEQWVSIPQKDT